MSGPFDDFRIHYKEMPYRVHGNCRHSENLEELVLYECLYENKMGSVWVRPQEMFNGKLEDGRTRFRKVSSIEEIPQATLKQISIPDFRSLTYLKSGNSRQQEAFDCLDRFKLFQILEEFDPVLVGTIPLGIDIAGSDLAILCSAKVLSRVEEILKSQLKVARVQTNQCSFSDQPDALALRIETDPQPIEIFVQNLPTARQRGYLHLIAEARLLRIGGPAAIDSIREMKFHGLKTEPAFAKYFGIEGDPYSEILKYGEK